MSLQIGSHLAMHNTSKLGGCTICDIIVHIDNIVHPPLAGLKEQQQTTKYVLNTEEEPEDVRGA